MIIYFTEKVEELAQGSPEEKQIVAIIKEVVSFLEDKQYDQAMRAYLRLENELHIISRQAQRYTPWPKQEWTWEITGVNSARALEVLEVFHDWLFNRGQRPLLGVCRWCGKLYPKRGEQTKQRYCSGKHRDAARNARRPKKRGILA